MFPGSTLILVLRLRGGGDITNLGGIGAGGRISQKINKDALPFTAYNVEKVSRLHVTIINASAFTAITGLPAPPSPVDANTYLSSGLPWFALYDEHIPIANASTSTSCVLATKVNSVGTLLQKHGTNSVKIIAPDCVFCDYEKATLDLIPCGHRLCDDCSSSVTNCPSCQSNIVGRQRFAASMGRNEAERNDGVEAASIDERIIKLRLNEGTNRVTTFKLAKDTVSPLTGD